MDDMNDENQVSTFYPHATVAGDDNGEVRREPHGFTTHPEVAHDRHDVRLS